MTGPNYRTIAKKIGRATTLLGVAMQEHQDRRFGSDAMRKVSISMIEARAINIAEVLGSAWLGYIERADDDIKLEADQVQFTPKEMEEANAAGTNQAPPHV